MNHVEVWSRTIWSGLCVLTQIGRCKLCSQEVKLISASEEKAEQAGIVLELDLQWYITHE